MPSPRVSLVCFLIFVGAATVSPGYASADDEATVQARTHYLEAQKQFDLGQWDAAANEFSKAESLNRQAVETFVLLLSPFAPHLAEELWARLGHGNTLAYEPWPQYDESCMAVPEVEILVQINGKPRVRMNVPAEADADGLQKLALANEQVKAQLAGKSILKVIAVPGRLVNIVAK